LVLPVHGAPCTAHSGPNTAALVELYTSQECAGCRTAEAWLSGLAARGGTAVDAVALALHVDYRGYVAPNELAPRPRRLTSLQRLALAFTPLVMLQGRLFRVWETSELDRALARINATPARARLSLEIRSADNGSLRVGAAAQILDAAAARDAALYLAAYEERSVRTVLEWHAAEAFSGSRLVVERRLALVPGARSRDSGVAGFVQNRITSEVLQALILPACP
jgi:hypothetical protein